MSIKINLLPHREQRKREKARLFATACLGSAIIGALIVGAGWFYLDQKIAYQNERNQKLSDAITKLDEDIKTIEGLQQKKQQMLAQKAEVEQLQQMRPEVVHIFDQFTRNTPNGISIQTIKQTDAKIAIMGYAQSNSLVAAYMESLEYSKNFKNAYLVEIKSKILANKQQVSEFSMTVDLERPEIEGASGASAASAPNTHKGGA